jgi:hypothetical protein
MERVKFAFRKDSSPAQRGDFRRKGFERFSNSIAENFLKTVVPA